MKQLLQNVSNGEIAVEEVPPPLVDGTSLLVATRFSLISAGTERALVELGEASMLGKARARPDLARKVLESARTEGVTATYQKVRGRLDAPTVLGYSSAGVVLEACEDAPAARGELVACAGAGYAAHAEAVAVPRNLVARLPEGVSLEDAAYGTVATIALHGFRLTEARLGDVVAIVGLGLVGQLALEIAAAAGCVALGLDPSPQRAQLARDAGCFATTDPDDLALEARRLTHGRGADAVLVCAASDSPGPLESGIDAARERAVVSIVGDVPVRAPRAALFAKELRLVVSRSYGPGRYDPRYEERGIDYPAGYVRWTEGRNLDEVLRLMAAQRLRPSRLTTHVFDLDDGPRAYELLRSDEPSLGILLRYPGIDSAGARRVEVPRGRRIPRLRRPVRGRVQVGVIGAGTFARTVLLPHLVRRADVAAIATATGSSAEASARRFGARMATTDPLEVIGDAGVDAVLIATRHDTHAKYAIEALKAGKHVFVEKPPALTREELDAVLDAARDSTGILMVGFNRRFAPLAARLRADVVRGGPMLATIRVNAGRLPATHWTHDATIGGGRIVGEMCHFVDLAAFLAGAAPVAAEALAVGGTSEPLEDTVAATLAFPGGSIAQIVYSALGDPSLPKERVEVLAEAGAGVLDDFQSLELHLRGSAQTVGGRRDKGHAAELDAFEAACRSGMQPWPLEEMADVMRATFDIRDTVWARADG